MRTRDRDNRMHLRARGFAAALVALALAGLTAATTMAAPAPPPVLPADSLLPFEGQKRYTGGPHALGDPCAQVSVDGAAGLDFARLTESDDAHFDVLSVSGGWLRAWDATNRTDRKGIGLFVRIEHPNGIVTEYWHLDSVAQQVQQTPVDAWLPRGTLIGRAGDTGNQTAVHLHLELRTPKRQAVSWQGQTIDGYQVWMHQTARQRGLNYQGSATIGATKAANLNAFCGASAATVGNNYTRTDETNGSDPNTIFATTTYGTNAGVLTSRNVRALTGARIQRVSTSATGSQANGGSLDAAVSSDSRYIAFSSEATNLVSGDTNALLEVFLKDQTTGQIERVGIATDGSQANGQSFAPSVSADGRFVAFYSLASNLVSGDTNGVGDVFVRDRQVGTTERVSITFGGVQPNAACANPSISGDGRYVAFSCSANNLVPNDSNGRSDIFLKDRQTGELRLISATPAGASGNEGSYEPAVSGDGRFVVFRSYASDLLAGTTNVNRADVFVRDLTTGTLERANTAANGAEANDGDNAADYTPGISQDGRYVAFISYASNLTPGDVSGTLDVFVKDRQTGAIERVSSTNLANQRPQPSISADGRYVAFNSSQGVLVKDRQTGATQQVDMPSTGGQPTAPGTSPQLSSDGRYVAFLSAATNLVPNDTNGLTDVFVADRLAPTGP